MSRRPRPGARVVEVPSVDVFLSDTVEAAPAGTPITAPDAFRPDVATLGLPPIADDEVYIRCPACCLLGWTVNDPARPMPSCPQCGGPTVVGHEPGDSPFLTAAGSARPTRPWRGP